MPLREFLSSTWDHIQGNLFPWLTEELGPLSETHKRLISTQELVRIDAFLRRWPGLPGRPLLDRAALARAFVAKMVMKLPTTSMLIEYLGADKRSRRLCGWERPGQVPSEATFSRAFAEFAPVMGPLESSRGRAELLPFVLSGSWPSEVEPPQRLAAGYLLPYVVSAEAAYMMRSDRGMVSLSGVCVIRRKRDLLLHLRLHQFHRPSDGTSELGFMQPRSSFFSLLYQFLQDVNSYLFDQCQTNSAPFQVFKYEQHTPALSWHDQPPAWPCKLSISKARRGRRRRRD
jgi:hypothetical protein